MINKEDIYRASNKGLDIIKALYPDARRIIDAGKLKEAFKMRLAEKTASAHLKEKETCWIVTDFGDDQRPRNPIDLWMKEKNLSFYEAIVDINTQLQLGVGDIKADLNKPYFEKGLEAAADMKEGEWYYELNEKFTEQELAVMGPLVKQEHVDELHWYSVKWVGKVKDRHITKKYSTETYPIFMRECVSGDKRFFKKYEPLCADKAFRFMYIGGRAADYINGLAELKAAHARVNEQRRKDFEDDPENEGKAYRELKLDNVVLCSGERDSLCARSLGYWPLWLNSETAELEERQYKEIMKYADVLYNIPDKDETGIRRGRQLALRYPDIRTIWLPQRFERFRDNRGRARKDFKDWLELQEHPYAAMATLTAQALPARFWEQKTKRGKKGEAGETTTTISSPRLQYFLKLQGFAKIKDKDAGKTDLVRMNGNVVERVTVQDIVEFLINWSKGEEKMMPGSDVPSAVQSEEIQALIIDSPRTSASALDKISSVELDFTNYTPTSQLFFFENATVEVTANAITPYDTKHAQQLGRCVWKESVVPHKYKEFEPAFKIIESQDEDGEPIFDIDVLSTRSKVFCYLINSSRLFWRAELEESLESLSAEERHAYLDAHKFDIAGPNLTAEQRVEQRQCLMNKLFVIGYMLHAYKDYSRAWAPMAMDWRIGEDGECNGRSGKSFLFTQVISQLVKWVKLSGRNRKLLDNPHVFDQVTRHTRMLLIDDCHKMTPMDQFFDNITGDMTVNPKNNQSYNIPFLESPKLVFTTNYVPSNLDSSTDARLIYMVFSDYYHQRPPEDESNYKRSWSIRDDFGKPLFGSNYSEEEWEADLHMLLECEQFYLKTLAANVKIMPPMENIMLRKKKQDMAGNFEEWATGYFSPLGTHLDCFIERQEALEDFRKYTGLKDMTTNGFTKKLRAFVKYSPYCTELNPADLCTAGTNGRILKRKKDPMGMPQPGSPVDYIYVRTNKAALVPLIRAMREQEQRQNELQELQVPIDETSAMTGDKAF